MTGALMLFSACSHQPTQVGVQNYFPLNTETWDGINETSIGAATLALDANGGLDVTGMSTISDGMSTDVSSKTGWDETFQVEWPEIGSDTMLFNALYDGSNGQVTTSSLFVKSSDTNTVWLRPIFTGQTQENYTLSVYNGSNLLSSETGLGTSSNPVEIRSTPYTWIRSKSVIPSSLVMGTGGIQTDFTLNSTSGTCAWSITMGSGVDSVTTPHGITYGATKVVLTEVITSGNYSYNHIQQLGNVGAMLVDTLSVN